MLIGDSGVKKKWSQASTNFCGVMEDPQAEDNRHRRRPAWERGRTTHQLPDGYRTETESEGSYREDRICCSIASQGALQHLAIAEHIAAGAIPLKICGISLSATALQNQVPPSWEMTRPACGDLG